ENLDQLDQDLVALEANPQETETLASIFRTIHTLKGTCGFLGFNKLEGIAHVGENLLSKLREGELPVTQETISTLLATGDAIRQILDSIEQDSNEGVVDYSELVATLTRLQNGGQGHFGVNHMGDGTEPSPGSLPPPEDLGIAPVPSANEDPETSKGSSDSPDPSTGEISASLAAPSDDADPPTQDPDGVSSNEPESSLPGPDSLADEKTETGVEIPVEPANGNADVSGAESATAEDAPVLDLEQIGNVLLMNIMMDPALEQAFGGADLIHLRSETQQSVQEVLAGEEEKAWDRWAGVYGPLAEKGMSPAVYDQVLEHILEGLQKAGCSEANTNQVMGVLTPRQRAFWASAEEIGEDAATAVKDRVAEEAAAGPAAEGPAAAETSPATADAAPELEQVGNVLLEKILMDPALEQAFGNADLIHLRAETQKFVQEVLSGEECQAWDTWAAVYAPLVENGMTPGLYDHVLVHVCAGLQKAGYPNLEVNRIMGVVTKRRGAFWLSPPTAAEGSAASVDAAPPVGKPDAAPPEEEITAPGAAPDNTPQADATRPAEPPASADAGAIPKKETANSKGSEAKTASSRQGSESIRVDVQLLDNLMNLVGELVLSRNQLVQFAASRSDSAFLATTQNLDQLTSELQESVMKTRMQPIGNLWSKYPRVVRDLSVGCGKQVRLEMEGKE
ncbi:MAG: Hpt domain-containing protein, partial [Nitrospinaceae bacterium]